MASIKDIFRSVLAKGFFVTFSTGRPFDPGTQERTDAIQDLVKQKRKEDKEAKHGYNDDVA